MYLKNHGIQAKILINWSISLSDKYFITALLPVSFGLYLIFRTPFEYNELFIKYVISIT